MVIELAKLLQWLGSLPRALKALQVNNRGSSSTKRQARRARIASRGRTRQLRHGTFRRTSHTAANQCSGLVVSGEHDRLTVQSASQHIEKLCLNDSALSDGGGHLGHWEYRSKVNTAIVEFADKLFMSSVSVLLRKTKHRGNEVRSITSSCPLLELLSPCHRVSVVIISRDTTIRHGVLVSMSAPLPTALAITEFALDNAHDMVRTVVRPLAGIARLCKAAAAG